MDTHGKKIILASNSPRRRELLAGLGIEFTVDADTSFVEEYSPDTPHVKIPETVPAGDANGLANLVIELSQMEKSELVKIGQTGKIFYDEHFDKPKCLHRLDEIVGVTPQVGA